ncbi:GntR family transcriptional regulator [Luteolibacter arcticus]|uniref:GntR family transcriptional regulator n=1 Tax=Luteolibacter arcticus TaxID=1581411 RepID=A0ABT3GIR7_9BACT|nr:GntR family transcriptional regulator [Luteolibacter arcticus]MCW1923410.1 GntR family transcriptional regulator [Luteolibacter arcticus]
MKQPLPKQVHGAIRTKLLDGSLSPGSRLDYKLLAKELGVSTTPVREAVTQLASEGFVELVPRLGAVVRSLNQNSAREFYEVREAVETFAALKAAERLSPRHLEMLRKQLDIMERLFAEVRDRGGDKLDAPALYEFLDADLAFHKTILLGARNPALARTVEESHIQSRIFFADRGIHDLVRLRLACEQHGAILAALEIRDGRGASEAMRHHIQTSLQFTLDHLETAIEV